MRSSERAELEAEGSVAPLPITKQPRRYKLQSLQPLPTDLVTIGDIDEFELVARDRGAFKQLTERNWYEHDR